MGHHKVEWTVAASKRSMELPLCRWTQQHGFSVEHELLVVFAGQLRRSADSRRSSRIRSEWTVGRGHHRRDRHSTSSATIACRIDHQDCAPPSGSNPFGRRGGSSWLDGLHLGQGIPAPPHWQAWGPSQGWSWCASQTQPQSSQSRQLDSACPVQLGPLPWPSFAAQL